MDTGQKAAAKEPGEDGMAGIKDRQLSSAHECFQGLLMQLWGNQHNPESTFSL